jgi:hypothetical protein
MARFMVLYNSPESAADMMANATPEQMQEGMNAWMSWAQQCGDAIVDLGVPMQAGKHVESGSTSDSQSQASGYSILQADTLDAATAMLTGHPHLMVPGNSIDVLELLPMPGM